MEISIIEIINPIVNTIQAPGIPRYSVNLNAAIIPTMPPVLTGYVNRLAKLSRIPRIGEIEKISNMPPSILTHRISIFLFMKSDIPKAPI
ncbi:MAG TPA: hypothetical protein QF423_05075, partial [Candidatus Scalindua sp.]|nr:hypothetical protein [Candidatus Scalindua sp.]